MKVLQVITDTDRRGAQIFAVDLHHALVARGHDVRTVALVGGGHEHRLDVPVLGHAQLSFRTLRSLRREMGAVEVTVAHGSRTLPACALVHPWTRTPFVYRQISDSRFWAATTARRVRVRTFLRAARLVVALSAFSAGELQDYLRVDPSRIRIVPNGVPSGEFTPASASERARARQGLGLDPDRATVAFVGALVSEKGPDLALEAVLAVPEAQLVIAGEGPERSALERRARASSPDRVHILGSVDELRQVYAAADLVVLPSRGGDTMPATLVEAGLSELPAVATPIGAIEEIVVDGETGVIVPPGDLGSLTSAIESLLADPHRARALGGSARRRCLDRFDIDRVAEAWEGVLVEAGRTSDEAAAS